MPVLNEKDRAKVKEILSKLTGEVKLVFFTQEFECEYCKLTREMLEELAGLSDKIALKIHDLVGEPEIAERYGVTRVPATIVEGDRDYGIRFFGVPGGYEFTSLLEDIIDVSRGATTLPQPVLD